MVKHERNKNSLEEAINAINIRLEAIASRVEAIASSRLEKKVTKRKNIKVRREDNKVSKV